MLQMKTIRELLILVGVSIVVGFSANYFSPNGIALFGDWDITKGAVSARVKGHEKVEGLEIGAISTAKAIYDGGGALFVDARSEELFFEGHIKGAVSMPAYMFEARVDGFLGAVPLDLPLVCYCSGRECEDSHMLAERLMEMGYENVRVFIDGYPAWAEEGYPIE